MAKKGRKQAGSGSKAARLSSAGQGLRDAADPVIRLVNSPIVSDLIASALIAGAGALVKSRPGEIAAQEVEEKAETLVEGAQDVGKKGANLASLVAYSIAIAAGEIAGRLAAAYEQKMGSSDTAEQVARAARRAADVAWDAFGKERA